MSDFSLAGGLSFSPIKKGSVVSIWSYPKGHNYVVAGEDTENKRLLLVKQNTLNNNGTDVHKATKRFPRSVSYTVVGGEKVVKGISRVLGSKNIDEYDFSELLDNYTAETGSQAHVLSKRRTFVCTPVADNREAMSY